jgi:hypothetical protein
MEQRFGRDAANTIRQRQCRHSSGRALFRQYADAGICALHLSASARQQCESDTCSDIYAFTFAVVNANGYTNSYCHTYRDRHAKGYT